MDRRTAARTRWQELPHDLRAEVERLLGGRVAAAESRPGGWSPGSADRLLLADGRSAFVKAASSEVNDHTVRLHRREAEVLALLGDTGASPRLLGRVEAGSWFALVEEDVGGVDPDPASRADVSAVLDAVARLPRADQEARAALRPAEQELRDEAAGWRRLIADDALASVPLLRREADSLDALAARFPAVLAGDRVVHLDLRFDNALIGAGGRARLVDWPGAAIGAGWLDAVTVALEVRRLVGREDADLALRHPVFAAASADDVDVLLAVLGAYFFDSARKPPSPGVEAVRAFQRLQGGVVLAWLRERRPDLSCPGEPPRG